MPELEIFGAITLATLHSILSPQPKLGQETISIADCKAEVALLSFSMRCLHVILTCFQAQK